MKRAYTEQTCRCHEKWSHIKREMQNVFIIITVFTVKALFTKIFVKKTQVLVFHIYK